MFCVSAILNIHNFRLHGPWITVDCAARSVAGDAEFCPTSRAPLQARALANAPPQRRRTAMYGRGASARTSAKPFNPSLALSLALALMLAIPDSVCALGLRQLVPELGGPEIPPSDRVCTSAGEKCAGNPGQAAVSFAVCCDDQLYCGVPVDLPEGLWGQFCTTADEIDVDATAAAYEGISTTAPPATTSQDDGEDEDDSSEDEEDGAGKDTSSVLIIAVGAVSGVTFVALAALAVMCCKCSRRRNAAGQNAVGYADVAATGGSSGASDASDASAHAKASGAATVVGAAKPGSTASSGGDSSDEVLSGATPTSDGGFGGGEESSSSRPIQSWVQLMGLDATADPEQGLSGTPPPPDIGTCVGREHSSTRPAQSWEQLMSQDTSADPERPTVDLDSIYVDWPEAPEASHS